MINLGDVEVMRIIRLTALAFGLATPAMAAVTVPEEYQGVWAAARDCKENFQNVLSNVVNREFAACRVLKVLSSGHPESHTNTIYLNCGGSHARPYGPDYAAGDAVVGIVCLVVCPTACFWADAIFSGLERDAFRRKHSLSF